MNPLEEARSLARELWLLVVELSTGKPTGLLRWRIGRLSARISRLEWMQEERK